VASPTDAHVVLTPAAKAFRAIHTGIAVVDLAAMGYIWVCGITRRRNTLLTASVAALMVEGAALIVGPRELPEGRGSSLDGHFRRRYRAD
jgi:hypothetical protein